MVAKKSLEVGKLTTIEKVCGVVDVEFWIVEVGKEVGNVSLQ